MALEGDSGRYDVLTSAAMRVRGLPGISVEIGLRAGGGTKAIIDGLEPGSTHVAIDPYGQIPYHLSENRVWGSSDYTNAMRDRTLAELYPYASERRINFIFLNMTSDEFMGRFDDGIPFYDYGLAARAEDVRLVHFDGQHAIDFVKKEFNWFRCRAVLGAEFIFDDVDKYDHDLIDSLKYTARGWGKVDRVTFPGGERAVYRRIS